MKLKTLFITLLTLATAGAVNAQLLWKVTPAQGGPTSYLFATYHVAPLSVLDSVASFNKALEEVDRVYGEMDMRTMYTPASIEKLRGAMTAPTDSTLSKVLTAAQLDSVGMAFAEYAGPDFSVALLDGFTPMAVGTQLAVVAASRMTGFNPAEQLDTEIQTRAAALGKEIEGLETVDLQIAKLYGAPIRLQAQSLMRTVREVLGGNAIVDLYRAYRSGDLDALNAAIGTADGMTQEEADELIVSRNNAWVELLMGALPTASVLIAVGGAHLPGPTGLIEQLRTRGYIVEPAPEMK